MMPLPGMGPLRSTGYELALWYKGVQVNWPLHFDSLENAREKACSLLDQYKIEPGDPMVVSIASMLDVGHGIARKLEWDSGSDGNYLPDAWLFEIGFTAIYSAGSPVPKHGLRLELEHRALLGGLSQQTDIVEFRSNGQGSIQGKASILVRDNPVFRENSRVMQDSVMDLLDNHSGLRLQIEDGRLIALEAQITGCRVLETEMVAAA